MKMCNSCATEKDENEFPLQKRKSKNGTPYYIRNFECRLCKNKRFKNYFSGNKTHISRIESNRQAKKDYVTSIKLALGCNKCGYKKCGTALHFHHINPEDKSFEISWAVQHKLSNDKIDAEISKCVLLCANCHHEEEENKKRPSDETGKT